MAKSITTPRTYPSAPVVLPDRTSDPEPTPADGCAGCSELANARTRARQIGDMTTVSDCNVLMRRHPEGH
ncbi:hypothetical protein [Streptomyces sp. NPDC058861]|uniref:hypothetical protein n=1 Tax=Streptomyces sp. NPDC058861 TaxID=3346653 RepID=UPI0036BA55AC